MPPPCTNIQPNETHVIAVLPSLSLWLVVQGEAALPAALDRESKAPRPPRRRGFCGDSCRLGCDGHRNAPGGQQNVRSRSAPRPRLSQANSLLEPLGLNEAVSAGFLGPEHPPPPLRESRGTHTHVPVFMYFSEASVLPKETLFGAGTVVST